MKLAVIGTFYMRFEQSRAAIRRVLYESSRPPDEFWIMCETELDEVNARGSLDDEHDPRVHIVHLPTRRNRNGEYSVVPYSNKINYALNETQAEVIVYLDNGSLPHPHKYEMMLFILENMGVPAVYCTQKRTGYVNETSVADRIVKDAYCVLNYTQVMHLKTDDRWSLDMMLAVPNDLVDAHFWRALHKSLGEFYPVPSDEPLDDHHIPSPAMNA